MITKMIKFLLVSTLLGFNTAALAGDWSAKPYKLPLKFQKAPTETEAALRIGLAPTMPPTAERSGYCCMIVDISASGEPHNIRTSYCSEKKFKKPSLMATKEWRFAPAVKDGQAIATFGQIFHNKFRLQTQSGRFLPDIDGKLSADPRKGLSPEELCRSDIIS